MRSLISILILYFLLLFVSSIGYAQQPPAKKVVITGVRFAYPLVEYWIKEYKSFNPGVEVIIDSRTSVDPANYDLLIEAYEAEAKPERDYTYIARYALFPVANSKSAFAKIYSEKGLNEAIIKQVFFEDVYADKDTELNIRAPYTIYTRVQKAGAPVTFARYFGFDQKSIGGKAIAGADEHLVKSVLKDSTGVTYAPLGLLFDLASKKPAEGLTILPVDANGNGRVNDEEKFYTSLDQVITRLEDESQKTKNIPVEYIHVSIKKENRNPDATAFLNWIAQHKSESLHEFGFLKLDAEKLNPTQQLTLKK